MPGLYFVGFFDAIGGGNLRMMDDQAEWIDDLVTGRAGLPGPATMQAGIQRERARVKALYSDGPRYGLELDPAEYRASLARERRGRPGPPPRPPPRHINSLADGSLAASLSMDANAGKQGRQSTESGVDPAEWDGETPAWPLSRLDVSRRWPPP